MAHDPEDVFATHQIALASLLPLTMAQERWRTWRILAARRRFCLAALSVDHVARTFVATIRGVAAGRLKLDRNTAISPFDLMPSRRVLSEDKEEVKKKARDILLARTSISLPTVEALLNRGTPSSRRKAAVLLLELCPRVRAIEQSLGEAEREFGADTTLARKRLEVLRRERALMADANLRLVASVAKRYKGPTFPIEDVVGYGHDGLMRAVDHFDPRWGLKFSTMATNWVERSLKRAMGDGGRAVRLPPEVRERAGLAFWAKTELRAILAREPEWSEVASHIKRTRGKTITPDQLRAADTAIQPTATLDNDDGEGSDGVAVADDGQESSVDVEHQERRDAVNSVLRLLTYVEREVMKMRYGLGDGWTYTLEECGRVFGVTRERVRQLESGAIHKMRTGGVAGLLEGHL